MDLCANMNRGPDLIPTSIGICQGVAPTCAVGSSPNLTTDPLRRERPCRDDRMTSGNLPERTKMAATRICSWSLGVLAAVLLGAAATAVADPGERPDYRASLYLWGAGIQAETPRGSDVDVGFDTIIRNLDLAFMGAFEARRGPWSVIGDLIYLHVGLDDGATLPVTVAGRPTSLQADARIDTRGWVLELFGAYALAGAERASVDALLGVRYLDLTLDFDLDLSADRPLIAVERSAAQRAWDLVAGLKGRVELGDGWFLPWWADVGTGDSAVTWQLVGGVGYAFDRAEVSLLYRHLAWDFGGGEQLDNLAFSGPMLAASWRF